MNDLVDPILDILLGKRLHAQIATNDPLDVRAFSVRERMSELYHATVVFHSPNQSIDFDAVVGQPATLRVRASDAVVRTYQGICSHIHQIETASEGLATYQLEIVPTLWFATQRRNYRMFQQMSDPDIVLLLLEEWQVPHEVRFDEATYKKRKYRVQYAETDYVFLKRLLEDAGIAFYFDPDGVLVLTDTAEKAAPRPDIRYNHEMTGSPLAEQVTDVNLGRRVRPGKYVMRDHDYRRSPSFDLQGSAAKPEAGVEAKLERFHYVPGAFLFEADPPSETPTADDKGAARHDPAEGKTIAHRRLDAKRGTGGFLSFQTNSFGLRVGEVLSVVGHPHQALAKPILVLETIFSGAYNLECGLACEAASTTIPHRPELTTPKPRVQGVESATVVGPAGQEIHTDEFGRVRVHFHWDRESKYDDFSSCWIHVSQPWAGATFGAINIPRVGQEVIVDFLGGDPDRPVIVGRVFTNLQRVPYPLPANQTKSGWRSQSTPGGDGYNEIMFEDKKGSELFSMHAEKDMATVVEHDESLDVFNDRRKSIGGDESVAVGRHRSEQVGANESVSVGGSRSRSVGADETVSVGGSRSRSVAANETIGIGGSRTRTVALDDTLTVGGVVTRNLNDEWRTIRGDSISTVGHDVHETIHHDRVRLVANDETFTVGNNLAGAVSGNSTLTVDKAYALAVGAAASRAVGADDSLTVGASQSTDIGESQSVRVGSDLSVEVGASATESVGGAKSVVVGAALVESVGLTSTETVGGLKKVAAAGAIELESGVGRLHLQPDGSIKFGEGTFELPFAKLEIEGPDHDRRLAVSFGESKLLLFANGAISLVGNSLDFNGQPVSAAPSAPPPPPPSSQWPPAPAAHGVG